MIEDKQIVLVVEKLILGMRGVIDSLAPAERKRVLASLRSISPDVADRLEAPSGCTN